MNEPTRLDCTLKLQTYILTGTTTASGAIEIPLALRSYELLSTRYTAKETIESVQGFVFRRDPQYLHCNYTNGSAASSKAVAIMISYLATHPVI